jgi:hypothetical protein
MLTELKLNETTAPSDGLRDASFVLLRHTAAPPAYMACPRCGIKYPLRIVADHTKWCRD